jgi:L-ascorbate metabolism protein UlaG (beta-lactamase superfamily)
LRVVFLGHACHLVELDGRRVLTDPWLVDPIFGGRIGHDVPLGFGPGDLPPLDAVALTHGHLDHFNAPSLAALPDKSVPVVVPVSRFTEIVANLHRLGFANVVTRKDWQPFALGSVAIVPTPAPGVLDECAYFVAGRGGRFFDGADAPQPPELVEEIAARLGPADCAALSHNSFDMPALLGLASHKPADHGPQGGARTARLLGCRAAFAAASSMRWRGPDGDALTRTVIRRSPAQLREWLGREAPDVEPLDLAPGDAWSREGGLERGVLCGRAAPAAPHDYLHAFLDTGERHCPPGRPSTEDTFRRDLPARTLSAPEAALGVGQTVCFEIGGDDPGTWTADFRAPGARPVRGDAGAPFAVRVPDADWKDLFERRASWQVLLSSGRLRVTRFRAGPPPEGIHFVYALQALFP